MPVIPGVRGDFRHFSHGRVFDSTGKHSLDLQVSEPSGRTAEAIKPDVVALANATIAKLP